MKIIQFMGEDLGNLMQVINPGRMEQFFANLKSYPTKPMTAHNMILGIFTFFGYFLGFEYYTPIKYSFVTSFKLAILFYIISVSTPLILGHLLSLFSKGLINKKVDVNEGVTIASYSVSIGLIGGIFRIFTETWVLHVLLILYSMYLFYVAIKIRFGFEKSLSAFLFLIVSTSIIVMILSKIIVFILSIENFYY